MRRNLATPLLRKPREKLSFTRSKMIMKTILVTGATGKVGSHFVPRLLQREHNVRLLVRRAEQAEAFRKLGAEAIVGDLSQEDRLAAAEQALLDLYHTRGLGVRILRLGFVYGEGDPHVHESLPMLSQWHPAKRLHMVHHDDVSQALLRAVTAAGIDGQVYNVADDAPMSLAELRRLNGLPEDAGDADAPFKNPWELILDTLRIRDELGFRPIYPSYYAARDAGAL